MHEQAVHQIFLLQHKAKLDYPLYHQWNMVLSYWNHKQKMTRHKLGVPHQNYYCRKYDGKPPKYCRNQLSWTQYTHLDLL